MAVYPCPRIRDLYLPEVVLALAFLAFALEATFRLVLAADFAFFGAAFFCAAGLGVRISSSICIAPGRTTPFAANLNASSVYLLANCFR